MEAEIEAELRSHLEMAAEDAVRSGMNEEEAQRAARLRFGNPQVMRERTAGADAALWMEGLWRDVKYALRQLRKAPGFAATVVLTLALGIGATTAVFSAMNAVLFRGLPVRNPQRLFYLAHANMPNGVGDTGDPRYTYGINVYHRLGEDKSVFADLIAYVPLALGKTAVRQGNTAQAVEAVEVSGNFFSGLGVRMAAGREFTEADEKNHTQTAVLSYGYWTRRLNRNPDVVGKTLYVNGVAMTVIGVAGPHFYGVESGGVKTDVWVPLQDRRTLGAWGTPATMKTVWDPNWWTLMLMARLRPGVTKAQALAVMDPVFKRAALETVGKDVNGEQPPLKLEMIPARGLGTATQDYEQPLHVLMGMVALVLLIACVNIAMLMGARNASREREFAMRLALGARRWPLFRQLLTESLLLTGAGAALGWGFALVATHWLGIWADLEVSLAPDGRVLLFMLGIPILQGRGITTADKKGAEWVVVVNETLAKRFFKGKSPIGHKLGYPKYAFTIVGVVQDRKYTSANEKPMAMAWYSYLQDPSIKNIDMDVEVRVAGNPKSLLPEIRRVLRGVDPDTPLQNPMVLQAQFAEGYAMSALAARLGAFFGGLAVLLVAVGLYGTLAYRVNWRRAEIGVWLALGAGRGQVLWMVLRESLILAAAGLAVGLPLAWFGARLMTSMLYELKAYDPVSFACAACGVVVVAAVAAWVPARRAAWVDPMRVLRME